MVSIKRTTPPIDSVTRDSDIHALALLLMTKAESKCYLRIIPHPGKVLTFKERRRSKLTPFTRLVIFCAAVLQVRKLLYYNGTIGGFCGSCSGRLRWKTYDGQWHDNKKRLEKDKVHCSYENPGKNMVLGPLVLAIMQKRLPIFHSSYIDLPLTVKCSIASGKI
jgi:hypothetical protein